MYRRTIIKAFFVATLLLGPGIAFPAFAGTTDSSGAGSSGAGSLGGPAADDAIDSKVSAVLAGMAVGATFDPALAYQAAAVTGTALRAMGIRWDNAPVVDVNTIPTNTPACSGTRCTTAV
jgi:hypothetical protein